DAVAARRFGAARVVCGGDHTGEEMELIGSFDGVTAGCRGRYGFTVAKPLIGQPGLRAAAPFAPCACEHFPELRRGYAQHPWRHFQHRPGSGNTHAVAETGRAAGAVVRGDAAGERMPAVFAR